MAVNMVGIRSEGKKVLSSLARRKRVSQQGLLTLLVMMADKQRPDLGIIDIDWDMVRKEAPNTSSRNKRSWEVVVIAVRELMGEFSTAEEIATHTRFTLAQVNRAMKEITSGGSDED